MMDVNLASPKRIYVEIFLNQENESSYAAVDKNGNWNIVVSKQQADKYGIVPVLAHELGHMVSVITNDPIAAKDSRINGLTVNMSNAELSNLVVDGNDIYNSEKRAWDIGEMIAFHRTRNLTLRTYNFMINKLIKLATFQVVNLQAWVDEK